MNMQNGAGFVPPPQPTQQQQAYNPAQTQNMNAVQQQPYQQQQNAQPQSFAAPMQPAPVQQQFAPQQQPAQQQANPYPSFPSVAPNPNQAQPVPQFTQPAPAQQQTPQYVEQLYTHLAAKLNTTVEQVRSQLGDDPERVAALVSAAAKRMNQPAQAPVTPAQPQVQPQNQPVEVPVHAFQYMKQSETTGLWEPLIPQAQAWAYAQNQKDWESKQLLKDFTEDPTSILKHPKFEGVIKQQIQQQVETLAAQRELDRVRSTYREKLAPVMLQHDASGRVLTDFNGQPALTPFGQTFNDAAKALHDRGMAESEELYQYAMYAAERQHGMVGQAQQQQQQPTPPQPFQPLNGQYFPGQQQQQQGYQQQQPVVHQILRRNMSANSLQPGMGAPVRPPQPLRGMPLREAMKQVFQGVPDDLGLETYWNMVMPKQG